MTNLNKRFAFTLAELLIALGIIGVVAALTISALVQNTNNKKFETRFKKAIATLAQASLTGQAKYFTNYAGLLDDSSDSNCKTDSLSNGKRSMCALFNSTMTGHNYLGTYGAVKGANFLSTYSVSSTTDGFNPANYLLFSLADGSIIGFNPSAKGCTLAMGTALTKELLTTSATESDATGLGGCVGFVDVNGVRGPNKEVTCEDGTSALGGGSCTVNKFSDVYPVVFHDGTVEPATNAARALILRDKSGASGSDSGNVNQGNKTITYNGKEATRYCTSSNDHYECNYYYEDKDGNLHTFWGGTYAKQPDGTYKSGDTIYDKDMNPISRKIGDKTYTEFKCFSAIDCDWFRKDSDGNYFNSESSSNISLIKQPDGRYFVYWADSSYTIYDENLNKIGSYENGTEYKYKYLTGAIHDFNYRIKSNGDLVDGNKTLVKQSDGSYKYTSNNIIYLYDKDLNPVSATKNGEVYEYKGGSYGSFYKAADDNSGNIVDVNGNIYTKRDDGLYDDGFDLYDEDMMYVGEK